MRFHGFFAQEQAFADLPVHEAVRDQLKHLDLPHRRLLLELLERAGEWDHLSGAAVPAPRRCHFVEPASVVHVTGQDLFALSCIHERSIGATTRVLEGPNPF